MTRFQHRPITGSPFYTHVIIDTHTGEEVAWSTSLSHAEMAVRVRNEDEEEGDTGITLDELIAKHGSQLTPSAEQLSDPLLKHERRAA